MQLRSFIFLAALTTAARAQSMTGMSVAGTDSVQTMRMGPSANLIDSILTHSSSGTSAQPPSTPVPMWMYRAHPGGWQLMLHGNAFVADTQQHATTTPSYGTLCPAQVGVNCDAPDRRGSDKFFSTNWIMPMAMHRVGEKGLLTVRGMFDLEPATISHGEYSELFQQGETAGGKAIVDGQHPHDAIMEVAALYDYRATHNSLLSLYVAPVGDPALGPTAYPHRMSASEDPIAALGHHQEDSTHIAFNVVTGAVTYRWVRVEESGFHGAEPTEARWHFEPSPNGHALDSYSTRVTVTPSANWTGQYSVGHLVAPEQLHPQENQQRQTASVMYNRPLGGHHDTSSMPGMDMGTAATGNWSNTLLWGRTKSLSGQDVENSFLFESLLNFKQRNYAWTRIEVAGRSNELISVPVADEYPVGHVQAYTLGYDRDHRIAPHVLAAPGAQFTLYRSPDTLASIYGRHPFGAVAFVRFRITR